MVADNKKKNRVNGKKNNQLIVLLIFVKSISRISDRLKRLGVRENVGCGK